MISRFVDFDRRRCDRLSIFDFVLFAGGETSTVSIPIFEFQLPMNGAKSMKSHHILQGVLNKILVAHEQKRHQSRSI
jgi:hypothetical protein